MNQPSATPAKGWRKSFVTWCIRLGLFGILAVLLATAVIVGRALSLASQQLTVVPIEHQAVNEKAAQRFAGALRFRTVSAPGEFRSEPFMQLHEYLKRQFPLVHAQLHPEVVSEFSLLYHWVGSDQKAQPILLMSHLDVVPVPPTEQPRWTHSPWSGDIADGYIWGRGAIDVK